MVLTLFFSLSVLVSIMVGSALFSVLYFRVQLLVGLLSLEFMVLGLFVFVIISMADYVQPVSISFYMLVLGASEASLGLSLLVVMTRFKGSDLLSLLSSFKC